MSENLKDRAPGALDTVRAFVNTLHLPSTEVEARVEDLDGPHKLREWLGQHGLPVPERVTARDLQNALDVREALRWLLRANAGEEPSPEAARILSEAAERARLSLRFAADGSSRLEPRSSGVDGALGALLGTVAAAMADGTWSRLKACRADNCHWAFYDHTRNRSGVWCDMAVCGNRAKVRAYRHRHAGEPA